MKCEEVRGNLAAFLDGEIEGAPRRAVDEHLAACPACAGERRALAAAWRLLDLVPDPAAPAGLEARVLERVRAAGPAPRGRLLRLGLPAAAAAALLVAAGVHLATRGPARVPATADGAPPGLLEDLPLLEALDLLEDGDFEAVDRLSDVADEDLGVLGG